MLDSLATLSDQDMKKQLKEAFSGLSTVKVFVQQFAETTRVTNELQALLKTQGLDYSTFCQGVRLLNQLSPRTKVHKRLMKWLTSHYSKWARLGLSDTPLLVSSDIIESLFGRFKTIIVRSSIEDINRMALVIPALCGKPVDAKQLQQVFVQTRHDDIKKWSDENISHTLKAKRREFKEKHTRSKCQKVGKKAA